MNFKILQIILLLIFMFCCTCSKVQGQSIVGGELSYNYISPNNYEIVLDVYADCSTAGFLNTQVIDWNDLSCGVNANSVTANLESGYPKDVSSMCADSVNGCNGGTTLGVSHYRYSGLLSLTGSCSNVLLSWTHQFRQSTVTNLSSPSTQAFCIDARLNGTIINSAPDFLYKPLFFSCQNQLINDSYKAIDADGDSLAYSLVPCSQAPLTAVNYAVPYSASNPMNSGPTFFIDNLTGAIQFNASTPQEASICVLVEEYRNGVSIGAQVRDAKLSINNCINLVPSLSGVNNTASYQIGATVNTPLNFFIIGNDLGNAQHNIDVTMLYDNTLAGANFTTTAATAIGPDAVQGNFNWIPALGDEGIHSFTVYVDDYNCARVADQVRTYRINVQPPPANAVITSPDTSICLGDSAQLNAIGTGPNPVFSWAPNTGLSNVNIANPQASPSSTTTYMVTASYSNGAVTTDEVTVTVNARPSLSINSQVDATCANINDGRATVMATGSAAPYTYQWGVNTGNQTTNIATGLATGVYQVLAQDANGCTDSTTVTIGASLNPQASIDSVVNILCHGDTTGSIAISASGGIAPYNYIWNAAANNQTTATAIDLVANVNYFVRVTDSIGCLNTLISTTLTELAPLAVNAVVTSNYNGSHVTCFGERDGVIRAFASGGAGGYTYFWNTFATSDSLRKGAGRYTVTVTDANGCQATSFRSIANPSRVNANITGLNSNGCFGGVATGVGVGGTPGYTYLWSDGQAVANAVGLQVVNNPYSLTVTDANGCTGTISVSIGQNSFIPPKPDIQARGTSVCVGGSISLTTTTVGVPYRWTGPNGFTSTAQSPTLYNVGMINGGDYFLAIQDTVTGCFSADTSIFIGINGSINPPTIIGGGIVCTGETIRIEDQTIAPNCSLLWLGPVTNQVGTTFFLDINPGDANYQSGNWRLEYTDTITGCIGVSNAVVVDLSPTPPLPNPVINGSACHNGSINLSVLTIPNATANWYVDSSRTNGAIYTGDSITIPGIRGDTIFYVEYISPSCTSLLASINVTVNANPAIPNISADLVICEGNDINLFTTTNASTFNWSHPIRTLPNQQNITITPSVLADSGLYTLSIVDTNGCVSPDTFVHVTINGKSAPLAETNAPICSGEALQLYHSGGCAQNIWLGPNGTTISVATDTLTIAQADPNYQMGDWRFICQDTLVGCIDTSSFVNVTINPNPPRPTPFNNGPTCTGRNVRVGIPLVNGASYFWYSDSLLMNPINLASRFNLLIPNITTDSTFYVELRIGNCSSVMQTLVEVYPEAVQPDIPADFDICDGDTLSLTTPNNGNRHDWSLPLGAGVVRTRTLVIPNASPSNTGLYTLSMRDLNGCNAPDTSVYVTVNPIPNPPTISSVVTCSGQPLILIAAVGCDSVEWTGPLGNSFITGDTLFVPPGDSNYIDGGNWTASCIDNSTNCNSLLVNYVVQIRPNPPKPQVNNNGPICIGESVLLSTPFILGASYNWYTGDSSQFIGSGNVRAVPNIRGDSTFLLSIEINGCTNSDTTQVQVLAQPTGLLLPDTMEVCIFDTLQLTTVATQPTYLWSGPNGFSSTQQNPFLYPTMSANAGLYTLVVGDSNNCTSEEDSMQVIVNALPIAPTITAQNTSVCNGDTLFLASNQNCGQLFWEGPSGAAFLAGDSIFIDQLDADYQNGNWTVLCVDSITGCEERSNVLTTRILTLPGQPILTNVNTVCAGDSVDLSISLVAGASYQWFSFDSTLIDTFPTITVGGLENDTIFYAVLLVDGCRNSDTTHVHVNPRPATPIVSALDTFCSSAFIQFTISPPSPSSGLTYTISGPNGYTSVGTSTLPFVSPIDTHSTGDYVIYASDANGCQSFDTTLFIVVEPNPSQPAITGTSIVCRGDSIRLETGTCDSLVWTNGSFSSIISTGNNPALVIGAGMSGYDTTNIWQVRCFDTRTGCVSPFSSGFTVAVNDPPSGINPSNNGPVCLNESVTLSVAQQGTPSTYIWSTNSFLTDTVGTGTTITVDSITTTTTFYIEVTDAYGCRTIDSTLVLLSTPALAPDVDAIDSVLCEGEDINLSELNYTTGHQWTGPNGFVSNSQFPVITTATTSQSGIYSVFVRNGNACPSDTNSITIVVNALPTAPVISGSNTICDGDSVFLNTNTICDSAIWVSSLDSILGAGNQFALGPLDAGYGNTTWTLICHDTTSGCFDSSNTLAVRIIPNPPLPIISNNNPVCAGDDALLIAEPVFGATSTWYSDSLLTNSIAVGDTLIINTITNDSIVYFQQVVNTCFSPMAVDTIVYIPTAPVPTIGADQTLCQGDSIYLTTTTLASAYFWTDSSGFTSTQQNPIIPNATIANIGTYYLFLTDNNGCAAPNVSMNVAVNLPPPAPLIFNNDTTCNGDTLLFGTNRPPNVQIEWVTPNNDTFVTDSLVVITSDSIYYQFGQWTVIFTDTVTGCQRSMDTIFRIETIPTPGIIANSGPVCIGDSVVLSSAQIAGAISYIWLRGDTTVASIGQTAVIPTVESDTAFSLVIRTALGCNYFMDSNLVFVHPPSLAPSISVDTANCVGDLLQFSTNPAAGYSWTGPNGVFSYQQNPTIPSVTRADSGLYTLNIIDANGCNTADTSILVSVSGPPTAPIASTLSLICQGDTLFLNSTAGSCDAAYWVGPGNRILNTANAIIPSDSSDYVAGNWQVFCVDLASGCETGSTIINNTIQTVATPTVVNNGPICPNDSVLLSANFVAGANYLWFSDSLRTDSIGTTQTISVDSISVNSTFYVVLINSNACVSPLAQTTVTVQALAPPPMIGSNIQVCEGEDIQLLAGQSSLYGYNWTGPNAYTSNQENPMLPNASLLDTGTYTLSLVDANGCNSADTSLQVMVDPLPAAPAITNYVYLCANDTLYLSSDSVTAHCDLVQWIGPNGINYPVFGGDVAILPGDTNHIGGLWQVQCIDTTTGCFSLSNTSFVVINPSPDTQATTTDGPICIGGTVNLSTAVVATNTSYIWYADASLTTIAGLGTNPAIQNITTDTAFYLVLTNSGACTSDPIRTPVLTYPLGNTPLVSADTQYCAGDSILLTTPTIATSYYWSGGNGFVDSVQNPLLTGSATALDSGLYTLSVVDSNGCVSKDTSFRITINRVPLIPTVVSNSPICFGDTLELNSSGQCGQSQWIGPLGNSAAVLGAAGGGNNLWTIGTSTTIPPSDSSYGNASWSMICIDSVTGCRTTSNTITVVVNAVPTISLLRNTGPICTGDSVGLSVLAASASGSPLITWYSDAALTQSLGIGANISVYNNTNTTAFFVQITDPLTGCTTVDSTLVTVHSVSPAPSMPANRLLCEGDVFSLSTSTFANGYNWTGPNGFVSNRQIPTPFVSTVLDAGTYYLSVLDSNFCPSLTGTVDVTINPKPNRPIVLNSGPGCTGDSIALMASTILGATYDWFKVPSGTSIGQGQNYTLTNISLADTGTYYVVVTLNGCTATSDSMPVTIHSNSTAIATAGAPQDLCGIDTTTIRADIPPINVTGVWTTNSGATILNPNTPTTFVANLPVGTNVFYWTLSNGTCSNISFDSLIIRVASPSVDLAYAGVDQNLCAAVTTSLLGNSPILSNGTWTQSSAQTAAGVVINASNNPSTNLTGLVPGNSYSFVWAFDNGVCGVHSTDTVEVTVAIAPTISAQPGADIVTCTLDTLSLNATNPSVGTGVWTTNSSAVIITPTQANTIITNLQQDTTVFVWTLSNGSCSDYASDSMLIVLGGASPIANADVFNVITSNTATLIDVLPNDFLTANWDIYINTPMNSGQLLNLNNGEFELNLQGVTTNQRFIYELCNPICPANCDTALVVLNMSSSFDCVIPNIFTPNEDGVNDLFEVPCLINEQVAKLLVFNRWGDLVYQSDNYQNQWNGTHQGKVLPDGTYFYIMTIGEGEQIQGSIELRR